LTTDSKPNSRPSGRHPLTFIDPQNSRARFLRAINDRRHILIPELGGCGFVVPHRMGVNVERDLAVRVAQPLTDESLSMARPGISVLISMNCRKPSTTISSRDADFT
jgi:hypothetical protein